MVSDTTFRSDTTLHSLGDPLMALPQCDAVQCDACVVLDAVLACFRRRTAELRATAGLKTSWIAFPQRRKCSSCEEFSCGTAPRCAVRFWELVCFCTLSPGVSDPSKELGVSLLPLSNTQWWRGEERPPSLVAFLWFGIRLSGHRRTPPLAERWFEMLL
ncbi:unnamed protein product [Boreogadus saida]